MPSDSGNWPRNRLTESSCGRSRRRDRCRSLRRLWAIRPARRPGRRLHQMSGRSAASRLRYQPRATLPRQNMAGSRVWNPIYLAVQLGLVSRIGSWFASALSKLDIGVGQEKRGRHQMPERPFGCFRLLAPAPFFPTHVAPPIFSPAKALDWRATSNSTVCFARFHTANYTVCMVRAKQTPARCCSHSQICGLSPWQARIEGERR